MSNHMSDANADPNIDPNLYKKKRAEFLQEKDRQLMERCNNVASKLIQNMASDGLPASIYLRDDLYKQLKWRPFWLQTRYRKAFLKKLARDAGVPANKVKTGEHDSITIHP